MKKPPFRCQEEGWGEFDMEIVLSTINNGGNHTLQHDLNFQSETYEARHTIVSIVSFRTELPWLTRGYHPDLQEPEA